MTGTMGPIQGLEKAWPREHHAACSGLSPRARDTLPAALETDPLGEQGCWPPEGPCVHALDVPVQLWTEDSATQPGRVLKIFLVPCGAHPDRSWVPPS